MSVLKYCDKCSLRVKILGSLFLVFSISWAIALVGIWIHQRDKLIDMTGRTALQAGLIVKAGLRSSMLQNNRETTQHVIRDMINVANLSRISVINKYGKVVMTSEPSLAGKVLVKEADENCLVCHRGGVSRSNTTAIIEGPDNPFLRTVIVIENEPVCHGCHPGNNKVMGVLAVDSSLSDTYATLRTVAKRAIITGLATFFVIILLINSIVNRFVVRPVEGFMERIGKIKEGDFDGRVAMQSGKEFGVMADSFNVMSRTIGGYMGEIKEKNKEITTLYTIVQRMSETIDRKKIKEVVTHLLCEALHAESAVLVLPLEHETDRFHVTWKNNEDMRHYHAEYQVDSPDFPHDSLSRRELLRWRDEKYTDPFYVDGDARAFIPLQLKDMPLGLMCIAKHKGNRITGPEKQLIQALAYNISISLANARLYTLAITDDLTNLYTKRHFQIQLDNFEYRYRTIGKEFCLMVLDLDHFKDVNDSYGHQVGDQVLVRIAELIRMNIRHGDIPCRVGGEEFAILLPGGDVNEHGAIAERLRRNIADHAFSFSGCSSFQLTVSIGLSCYPSHVSSTKGLFESADIALYTAKREGRNQVVVSADCGTA